ncbi:MAG: SapC family protein [Erythrobacter sp.]
MATAPQPQLPLFYKDLLPLNSRDHADYKVSSFKDAEFLANTHMIPITVDEFVDAQRHYPIIFTGGENPLPVVLMGLNEGVNTFIDEDGKLEADVYVPAYVRRYPFILAKLNRDSDEMSLCFDPSSGVIGKTDDGQKLFEDGEGDQRETTEYTKGVLEFCTRFEQSGQRTRAFLEELKKHDLLRDGRMDITRRDMPDTPFTYTGFQMVNEEKLRELDSAVIAELNKSGMLMLMHAQLFSMNLMRHLFERQSAQGKVPMPNSGSPGTPAVPNGTI